MNYYHPQTMEHIRNPLPAVADWAISTSVPVPSYDPQAESCRFVEGAWLVEVNPQSDPLYELISQEIKRIDAESDALVRAVIGERSSEYELAEREALAYKAAGYPVTSVPDSVSAWAIAQGWTSTQATDSILELATAWRTAQAALRAGRLLYKQQVAVAIDAAAVNTAKADWSSLLTSLKTSLGV